LQPGNVSSESFSERERTILGLVAEGKSNVEIADTLVLSENTVKWYLQQVYSKLNVRSRVQAIMKARELNLIVGNQVFAGGKTDLAALPEPINPYKGLHAFQATDHEDFFGRERMVERLLKRLTGQQKLVRFLAVVGPSGSGKSSLIKAGLIPALWRGKIPGSDRWFVAELMPGQRPLDELEVALTRIAGDQRLNLAEHLARDKFGLLRATQLVLPDDRSELLLVIDQFEELFTLVETEDIRVQFLDLIHAAVTDPHSRVRVIITLRADFYDRPLQYIQVGEMVQENMETVLPLGAAELEQAITRPAERVGVAFEEGLVAAIIEEVFHQPGGLPLLQYALTELFESRENRTLTHVGYQKMGCAVGALKTRAEEIYNEFGSVQREAARQLFLRMVTLGEGVEDTRRRVHRSELLEITGDPAMMDDVIDTFASYRLLALDQDPVSRKPTVEVAHDALLREWGRLREWLDESRADIRLQRQLANAASEWDQAGKDSSFLLSGARLQQFDGWRDAMGVSMTPLEWEYLQASRSLHDREVRKKERQRQWRTRLLAGAMIIAVVLTILAVFFGVRAAAERDRARSVALAAQAELFIGRPNSENAVLLALEALQRYPYTTQAEHALGQAVEANRQLLYLTGHKDAVNSAAWSPDGKRIVTASVDKTAIVWDAATGKQLLTLSGHSDAANSAAWSPDGKRIVTASVDKTAIVWDAATGKQVLILSGHSDVLNNAAFSPDGTRIVTSSNDDTAIVWDAKTGKPLLTLSGHTDRVRGVAWSPDGTRIATASLDHTSIVWDAATGKPLLTLSGSTDWLISPAWSPDGTRIATANRNGTTLVWDAATGKLLLTLSSHTAQVNTVMWSPDGQRIVTSSWDSSAKVWDAATGKELFALAGDTNTVSSAAWSPDGKRIVTSSRDGTVREWDASTTPALLTLTGHTLGVETAVWALDGKHLATASDDGTARMWDAATGKEQFTFTGHSKAVVSLAWSPDKKRVVTGSSDNSAKVWDAGTGKLLLTLTGHTDNVRGVTWSPDGTRIATASADETAVIWDAATGQKLFTLKGHKTNVNSAAWSPDGKRIVTASYDKTAIVWDATTGQPVLTLSGHTDALYNATWSPDGTRIATASNDGTARIWDASTGTTLTTLIGHVGGVIDAEWSPNGTRIVTAGFDAIANVWDAATGKLLLSITGHASYLNSASWSPDGMRIATASDDGTAKVWRAFPTVQGLIDYAQQCCVVRSLTEDERIEFGLPPH